MEGPAAEREAAVVDRVLSALARLLAGDGGRLVLAFHDAERRILSVVVGHVADPDPAVVRDYLLDALAGNGVQLADVRVRSMRPPSAP